MTNAINAQEEQFAAVLKEADLGMRPGLSAQEEQDLAMYRMNMVMAIGSKQPQALLTRTKTELLNFYKGLDAAKLGTNDTPERAVASDYEKIRTAQNAYTQRLR